MLAELPGLVQHNVLYVETNVGYFCVLSSVITPRPTVTDLQLFGIKIIDHGSNYSALFIPLGKQ